MRRAALLLALSALGLMASATHAYGQAPRPGPTGSITAHAIILQPPLTTVGTRALQFGLVIPGTVTTILPRSAHAGQLRISGVRNKRWATIAMTFPAALTGPGGATLPVNFNGEYAGLCEAAAGQPCDEDSYVAWNPITEGPYTDTPSNIRKRGRSNRQTYELPEMIIYMGGQALPALSQRAGTYTGTITVTVTTN